MMITYGKLPNDKYMINWPIEGNDYYVNLIEMTPEEREAALDKAKHYTMCFIYFMQHQLGLNTLGIADDEFPTADKLPFIPYHRESRRIHGVVRYDLNHMTHPYDQQQKLYRTSIAVGDYPVDHHHTRYKGEEELPNLYFHPVPSFGLPLGALVPRDVDGLIVAEKSISVSNIANGSTRLQPVVMQIGQAAGALASLAVKQNCEVRNVPVRDVQDAILAAGGYLQPYLDVASHDARFKAYQRIGSTGILKGTGKNVGWSNQTWLRADTLLLASELDGLSELYPLWKNEAAGNTPVTVEAAVDIIAKVSGKEAAAITAEAEKAWKDYGMGEWQPKREIKRGEWAVLLDRILDPFHAKAVDMTGAYIEQ